MARATSATFGFIGAGEVSPRTIKSILRDQIESYDEDAKIKFILPVTQDHWNDGVDTVATFAEENKIPWEIVHDESTVRGTRALFEDAVKTHKVADVVSKVVSLLEDAPNGTLVVFWDEVDALDAFEKADALAIPTHDITNGFDKVEFGDEDSEPIAEDDPEPEPRHLAPVPDEPDDEDEIPSGGVTPVQRFSEEELEALDFADVRDIWVETLEQEPLPPRTKKGTYIDAILKFQGADGATGEVHREEPAESLPEPAEDDVVLPTDEEPPTLPEAQERAVGTSSSLVGTCYGCGGPVFAIGEPPQVTWHHASGCTLG